MLYHPWTLEKSKGAIWEKKSEPAAQMLSAN